MHSALFSSFTWKDLSQLLRLPLLYKLSRPSVSYCMVCASVREDNPRALASGLAPLQTHRA